MSIKKYSSYFHDGSITGIKHNAQKLEIIMESAEINEDEVSDDVPISPDHRIKGTLHIDGVTNIHENSKFSPNPLRMKYADAEISHFSINKNCVEFEIKWNSIPATPLIKDFSSIEIKGKKIWWENLEAD